MLLTPLEETAELGAATGDSVSRKAFRIPSALPTDRIPGGLVCTWGERAVAFRSQPPCEDPQRDRCGAGRAMDGISGSVTLPFKAALPRIERLILDSVYPVVNTPF